MKKMKRVIIILSTLMFVLFVSACEKQPIVGEDVKVEGDRVKIVDVSLTEEYYGIGVNKDDAELLATVNAYIDEVSGNGVLDEIIERHMSGGEPRLVTGVEYEEGADQLLVASTVDFEPFEYGEVGAYYGIDMEIAQGLADYMGKDLVIVYSSFETMFLSVKQHKCDICIGGISITDERSNQVAFSVPYYKTGQVLVTPIENTEFDECTEAKEVEDVLRRKDGGTTIGVENLTTSQLYCKGEDGFEGFPVSIRGYRDVESAIVSMLDGECQFVIGDRSTVERVVKKVNGGN